MLRTFIGNSKVYQTELSSERFAYYNELREKVYLFHKNKKLEKEESNIIENATVQSDISC